MDNEYSSLENLPVFLNIYQAKNVLNISESSIQRYLKTGYLPYLKIGRRILIPKEGIITIIKKSFENCKNPTFFNDN